MGYRRSVEIFCICHHCKQLYLFTMWFLCYGRLVCVYVWHGIQVNAGLLSSVPEYDQLWGSLQAFAINVNKFTNGCSTIGMGNQNWKNTFKFALQMKISISWWIQAWRLTIYHANWHRCSLRWSIQITYHFTKCMAVHGGYIFM